VTDPRQKHGNHTWEFLLHYYRCPKCGYVIEDRNKYERRMRLLQKEVYCNRCQYEFTVTKKKMPTFGPLLSQED
jgi:rubredoxin